MPRILLVDDEPDIREALGEGLRRALGPDVAVDLAGNAREARQRLAGGARYDLVMADEKMPGEAGSDFLGWLRQAHPEAKRVLMSAFPPGSLGDAEGRAGPDLVVKKPFAFTDLVAQIRRMLEPG